MVIFTQKHLFLVGSLWWRGGGERKGSIKEDFENLIAFFIGILHRALNQISDF